MKEELKIKLANALAALEVAANELIEAIDELEKEDELDFSSALIARVDVKSIKYKFNTWLKQIEDGMPIKKIINEHEDKNLIIRFLKYEGLTGSETRVIRLAEVRDYAKNVLGIENPDKQIIESLNEIRFQRTNYLVKSTTHDFFTIGPYITNGKWEYLFDSVEFVFLNKDVDENVIIHTDDPGWLIGEKGKRIKSIAKYFNSNLNKKLKYIVRKNDEEH